MMDADNLAEVWIRLHHLPKGSSEHDALFWSWEKLSEMCDSAPETAWNVIQEIIALDHSDQILANVGAGPVRGLDGEPWTTIYRPSGDVRSKSSSISANDRHCMEERD
jgi:hypothetical protein